MLYFFLVQDALCEIVDGNRIMDQPMQENLCALTFDDGPSKSTPQLLDMLEEYHVPATFFILGQKARHHPETVRRIVAEGHEVGNHTFSHPNLRKLTCELQQQEIVETDSILRSLGATPLYLRPPYGAFDENTIKIAEELGLGLMLWSMDSVDWKRLPDDYAKLRSTRGTVYNEGDLRGIFLFHDIHKNTVEDLPRILSHLRAGGCERFVTVSEYLKGILDPEPAMLMTRRPAPAPTMVMYPAGSGQMPMARCSKPWRPDSQELNLEDAQAAVFSAGSAAN